MPLTSFAGCLGGAGGLKSRSPRKVSWIYGAWGAPSHLWRHLRSELGPKRRGTWLTHGLPSHSSEPQRAGRGSGEGVLENRSTLVSLLGRKLTSSRQPCPQSLAQKRLLDFWPVPALRTREVREPCGHLLGPAAPHAH